MVQRARERVFTVKVISAVTAESRTTEDNAAFLEQTC